MTRFAFLLSALLLAAPTVALAQAAEFTAVRAEVDFSKKLRAWDGFGVNYVESSHTFDYEKRPQDYGGFRFLSEADRLAIVELVFGDDGLQPGLVKMFLDPLHQSESGGAFDHARTTRSMRFFVREGLTRTRTRGDDLTIITTLCGTMSFPSCTTMHSRTSTGLFAKRPSMRFGCSRAIS